jgi:putative sigma-54 modulation protein
MKIEFQTPYNKASEKLLSHIRDEILKLSHINKEIVRAEVLLKEDTTIIPSENKVCEIKINVFGDDLLAHSRKSTFTSAAKEVIKELKKMVKHQIKHA